VNCTPHLKRSEWPQGDRREACIRMRSSLTRAVQRRFSFRSKNSKVHDTAGNPCPAPRDVRGDYDRVGIGGPVRPVDGPAAPLCLSTGQRRAADIEVPSCSTRSCSSAPSGG